jgi:NAD kinase
MGLRIDQKIVIVTRSTQLAALRRRYNTRSQARFQIVSAKKRELAREGQPSSADLDELAEASFDEVDRAAEQYDRSVQQIRRDLDFDEFDLPVQVIDRGFLPNFVFGPRDVVVTVGQDGLVANTAKYAIGLPIVAVNPDPQRIDGILLPFRTEQARAAVRLVLHGKANLREVTMAEAVLDDGQRLLAFNELFIGVNSHVSARYRLTVAGTSELQSSSGLIVSTGAGSTGWLSSVFNMAAGVARLAGGGTAMQPVRFAWEDPRLVYVVREPFVSKASGMRLVAGIVEPGRELAIESEMASNGVIFSDGVERDFLEFNAGVTARVRIAPTKARLVVA